jgi:SAM-dependent methyltransferase
MVGLGITMDQKLRQQLKLAYGQKVSERDNRQERPSRLKTRQSFLDLLQARKARTLLEVGAGTGQDAAFFASHGIDVLATDLTPENVEACMQKGLQARVMDACDLQLPDASYAAVYSVNCLLHLPKAEFPMALAEIRRVLRPNGLFFLGLWGGRDSEEVFEEDTYKPKRLFSFWSDETLKKAISTRFNILGFETNASDIIDQHFQAFTLEALKQNIKL